MRHTDSELSEIAKLLKAKIHFRGIYPVAVEELLSSIPTAFQGTNYAENSLISLLYSTLPNANHLFNSPICTEKTRSRWTSQRVLGIVGTSVGVLKSYSQANTNGMRKTQLQFSKEKIHDICTKTSGHIGVMPKSTPQSHLRNRLCLGTGQSLPYPLHSNRRCKHRLTEYPIVIELHLAMAQFLICNSWSRLVMYAVLTTSNP